MQSPLKFAYLWTVKLRSEVQTWGEVTLEALEVSLTLLAVEGQLETLVQLALLQCLRLDHVLQANQAQLHFLKHALQLPCITP